VKSSKAEIHARFHKIPTLRFKPEGRLTAYAGLVIFQALFTKLDLRARLRRCFSHLKVESIYGHASIVLLLVVHLLLGFRRLRGLDFYRDDPIVARVVGLRQLPDVSTVSRALAACDDACVEKMRALNRDLVLRRAAQEALATVTVDFDGSVQSTKGHKEGTAVGFNEKKKAHAATIRSTAPSPSSASSSTTCTGPAMSTTPTVLWSS